MDCTIVGAAAAPTDRMHGWWLTKAIRQAEFIPILRPEDGAARHARPAPQLRDTPRLVSYAARAAGKLSEQRKKLNAEILSVYFLCAKSVNLHYILGTHMGASIS